MVVDSSAQWTRVTWRTVTDLLLHCAVKVYTFTYLLTYISPLIVVFPGRYGGKVKVKVKVHTLNDIATPEDISFPPTTASITLITVSWS